MDMINPALPPESQLPRQREPLQHDELFECAESILELPDSLFDTKDQGLVDNPLLRLKPDEVDRLARRFVRDYGLLNYEDYFVKAGKILRDPEAWQCVPRLTPDEKEVLSSETGRGFWKQPKQLQVTIITLCVGAVVQGWTQVGTNGANLTWPQQFGLNISPSFSPRGSATWIFALVNAATYLSAGLVGCWLSDPLNEYFFGRRAAICVSAVVILASTVGGACSNTWEELLICRIILGLGMGCKASVVPVFAAEVSPAYIRGSLVMNWQLFDAFGIFLGFTANLVVSQVGPTAWRWQIASAILPTTVLLSLVYVCPESPRFLMKRGRYRAAFQSLIILRFHPLLAAKELFYVHWQMQVEAALSHGRFHLEVEVQPTENGRPGNGDGESKMKFGNRRFRRSKSARPINYWQKLYELFTVPRNRRAVIAAIVCMISQQLCGINVLIFFSATIFRDAGNHDGHTENTSYLKPLFLTWGLGLTNFLFAFPAYYFIDRKGRRWLLLVTLPFMVLSMLATSLSFLIKPINPAHTPVIAFWTFVFFVFYSWGMGPVPFTLSAEVFPLENRVVGMSFAVFCNLFGAGILALFVPVLTNAIGQPGLLGIFAGLNAIAFILTFFFVRETAGAAVGNPAGSMISMSLEELNYLFAVSTAKHAIYQVRTVLPWAWKYYVKRDKTVGAQPEKLYIWASARERATQEIPKTV